MNTLAKKYKLKRLIDFHLQFTHTIGSVTRKEIGLSSIISKIGRSGSGNFGHAGRPGKRGGSNSVTSRHQRPSALLRDEPYVVLSNKVKGFDFKDQKDFETARSTVLDTIIDIKTRFPSTKSCLKSLEGIILVDKNHLVDVSSDSVLHSMNFSERSGSARGRYIRNFNTIACARTQDINKEDNLWDTKKSLIVGGNFNITRCPRDTIRHEFGHHFYYHGIDDFKDQKIFQDEVKNIYYFHNTSFGYQNTHQPLFDARKDISIYSHTNERELFAESFAVYTHPEYKRGILPMVVEKLLDTYVGTKSIKSEKLNRIVDFINIKGGPGSGIRGHRTLKPEGESKTNGFEYFKLKDSSPKTQELVKEIRDKWPAGMRQYFAAGMLNSDVYNDYIKVALRSKEKELVGLAALKNYKDAVWIAVLATREKGYGTEMMKEAVLFAAKNNNGLKLNPVREATSFYEKIGMKRQGAFFFFSAEDCKRMAAEMKKSIDDTLPDDEPEDGVFCVPLKKEKSFLGITKGGPGSGNYDGPGKPRFARDIDVEYPIDKTSSLVTHMYGGIPTGGGYQSNTEYEIGHQGYVEAAHCILGSLGKAVSSGYKWTSIEEGHIREELGIMKEFVKEYSRDIYNEQLYAKQRDVTRSRYVEDTVKSLVENSSSLLKIATEAKGKIGDIRPDLKKIAELSYDSIIAVAKNAPKIKSTLSYNVFNEKEIKDVTEKLDNAVVSVFGVPLKPKKPKERKRIPLSSSEDIDARNVDSLIEMLFGKKSIHKHLPGRHDQSTHGLNTLGPVKRDEEFYHGTVDSYALKIMREGLVPNNKRNFDSDCYTGDRKDSVFVTKSFDNALGYALKMMDEFKLKKGRIFTPVVFKVKMSVNDLEEDELDPFAMRRKGKIPPELIVAFTTNRGKDWHDVSKKQDAEIFYIPLVIIMKKEEKKEFDGVVGKTKAKPVDKKKTEFVFRSTTTKDEKKFQKVMDQYFHDQEKAALLHIQKAFDDIEIKHLSGQHDQSTHGHQSEGKTDPMLFHGTTFDAVNAILKDGLIPLKGRGADEWAKKQGWGDFVGTSQGRKMSVYLTPYKSVAEEYAKFSSEINERDKGVILKVTIPRKVAVKKLKKDEQDYRAFRFEGKIQPEWISRSVDLVQLAKLLGVTVYCVICALKPEEDKAFEGIETKGGPGSGNYDGPGKPRFARDIGRVPKEEIPGKVYVGIHGAWYNGWKGMLGKPIKEIGLSPGVHSNFSAGSRSDSVYVAASYDRAWAYASLYSDPGVLEIDVNKIQKNKFYYDPLDVPLEGKPQQFAYRGKIPPSAIKLVKSQKSYFPFDSVEEHLLAPSIGLTRVLPRKKKVIQKSTETQEMKDHFEKRTKYHIDLVKKYSQKILDLKDGRIIEDLFDEELKQHDQSKYKEPEYVPYLHVSWHYLMESRGEKYEPSQEIKDQMNEATFHHVKNNKHHPEYWDENATKENINRENRDKPSGKIIDATKMPLTYIASMVADWLAMSEEKKTNPYKWMEVNVNKRWKFTKDQVQLMEDLIDQLWTKKKEIGLRVYSKASPNALPGKFDFSEWGYTDSEWNRRLAEEGGLFIKEVYDRVGKRVWEDLRYQLGDDLEGAFDIDVPEHDEFIDDYTFKFAASVNATTVAMLQDALKQGIDEGLSMEGIAKLVRDVFENCTKYRSLLIARTETIRATNGATILAYQQSGAVEGKEWLVTEDDRTCPFCNAMQGKMAKLNENFFDLGSSMTVGAGKDKLTIKFDYEDVEFPPLHPNCRCTVVPLIMPEYRLPKGIGLGVIFSPPNK